MLVRFLQQYEIVRRLSMRRLNARSDYQANQGAIKYTGLGCLLPSFGGGISGTVVAVHLDHGATLNR